MKKLKLFVPFFAEELVLFVWLYYAIRAFPDRMTAEISKACAIYIGIAILLVNLIYILSKRMLSNYFLKHSFVSHLIGFVVSALVFFSAYLLISHYAPARITLIILLSCESAIVCLVGTSVFSKFFSTD